MSADPLEGSERARPPKVIYLQWCGADKGDVSAEELATAPPHGEVTWCADKQFDTDEKYVLAGSLEQERDAILKRVECAYNMLPSNAAGACYELRRAIHELKRGS